MYGGKVSERLIGCQEDVPSVRAQMTTLIALNSSCDYVAAAPTKRAVDNATSQLPEDNSL
jgi:hypothetical protein